MVAGLAHKKIFEKINHSKKNTYNNNNNNNKNNNNNSNNNIKTNSNRFIYNSKR